MHGINWESLAAIVAVVGTVYGGASRLLHNFKDSISAPLSEQMTRLSQSIDNLTAQAERERKDFDERLDKHENALTQHDTEIGTLYNHAGLTRSSHHEN
ncbi:hypothetical protein FC84_GL001643 [Lapidilactobacillus dextrinicus DSM 20335]|uniref:Uncharacterized protein n=1 Tax=Lapidilactobacillus dextrinicus DSM 20335 TaxID=1423738 RepID=A0A0R2BIU6_9LACO|nr:hypothetical protein [Lapidilactobacillus dextrinicus]KRM79464.1 hypothetical protein FC84_GL001643 [Lapidilactobacillus dextrinicus DSM 20335]QFG46701.1 hypothetical protein LH506_04245 [Lapidilactobacillus dextrinicus]